VPAATTRLWPPSVDTVAQVAGATKLGFHTDKKE